MSHVIGVCDGGDLPNENDPIIPPIGPHVAGCARLILRNLKPVWVALFPTSPGVLEWIEVSETTAHVLALEHAKDEIYALGASLAGIEERIGDLIAELPTYDGALQVRTNGG